MKVLIGIPAYNEGQVISKVISSIPRKIKNSSSVDILVVDDGSDDKTSDLAEKAGAKVLSHLINRGLGGALKTILAYAKRNGYDILITFDADGQHDVGDIKRLIKALISTKSDVVIGSRWIKASDAPKIRYIINQLANILTMMLFGIWTTDSQSGLRVLNRKAIEKIQISSDGMEVSSEFFKEFFRHKLSFKEIPIETIYTKYSKKKGQKLSNSTNVFFKLIIKFFEK